MIKTYSFGERLKQRRKQLKLTQRELATAVYCSIAMIKKIEADERHPSVELAQALATTLQIPPNNTPFLWKSHGANGRILLQLL